MKLILTLFFICAGFWAKANAIVKITYKVHSKDRFQLYFSPIKGYTLGGFSEKLSISKEVTPKEGFQTVTFEVPEEMIPFTFRIDFGEHENQIELKKIELSHNNRVLVWSGIGIWQDFRFNGYMATQSITNDSFMINTVRKNGRLDPHMYLWEKVTPRLQYFFEESNLIESKICITVKVERTQNFFILPLIDNKIILENKIKSQVLATDSLLETCFYLYTKDRLDGFLIELGSNRGNQLMIKVISFDDHIYSKEWAAGSLIESFSFNYLEKRTENNIVIAKNVSPDGLSNSFLSLNEELISQSQRIFRTILLSLMIIISAITLLAINKKLIRKYGYFCRLLKLDYNN